MTRQSAVLTTLSFLLAAQMALPVAAQLGKSFPFKRRVSASPDLDLNLSEKQGPWLIMCASFVGERGEQQARQLALELRRDHNLESFIYRHEFDYSQTMRGAKWLGQTSRLQYTPMKAAHSDAFEEIAVVVGNFSSVDDSKAQAQLETIKKLTPRSLEVKGHVDTYQRMGVWREMQRELQKLAGVRDSHGKGPMSAAFLLPNPTLPEEYFANSGVDKMVLTLNRGIRHSLLDCPGKFSVRVATFRGDVVYDSNKINALKRSEDLKRRSGKPQTNSKLAEASEKAHKLCQALRKMNVEAYEFHDRFESYVCVGSFDWAYRKLSNGKDDMNPEIARVILEYKAKTQSIRGVQTAIQPKTLKVLKGEEIYFDAQPLPVMVPRAYVSLR